MLPEGLLGQFIGGALGDDAAVLHDANMVSTGDGFGMVSDGEDRPAACKLGECALDVRLTIRVGSGGGFIEDEDGGVSKESAGDG